MYFLVHHVSRRTSHKLQGSFLAAVHLTETNPVILFCAGRCDFQPRIRLLMALKILRVRRCGSHTLRIVVEISAAAWATQCICPFFSQRGNKEGSRLALWHVMP
jgi:hypothetical protein